MFDLIELLHQFINSILRQKPKLATIIIRWLGFTQNGPARFDITRLMPLLEDVHDRLAGVNIDCLDFGTFIERYDREGTLFYLDPPYWGNETDYGAGLFSREDFARLSTLLGHLKGKFILSLNDRKEVRTLFKAFTIKGVETTYSVGGGKKVKPVKEVIISNAPELSATERRVR